MAMLPSPRYIKLGQLESSRPEGRNRQENGINLAKLRQMMQTSQRLLTLNCHESWIHQLGYLGFELDIIDGLPGRYCTQWDTRMRPVPRRASLATLDKVLASRAHVWLHHHSQCHRLARRENLPGPRILVIHETLEGRIRQHGLNMSPDQLRLLVHHYLDLVGGHAVAISPLKARAWRFIEDVIQNCVDVGEYLPWSGDWPRGPDCEPDQPEKRDPAVGFPRGCFQGESMFGWWGSIRICPE